MKMFDLTGRSALVTGSSRGLGHAMAAGLARAGASVTLNGRDPATLKKVCERLAAEGLTVAFEAFDSQDPVAAKRGVDAAAARWGGLDILVGNAGINIRTAIEATTPADWDAVQGANLRGCFFLTQAALPWLKASKAGRILFTSSITGIMGRATIHAYASSKAGLAGLARSLAAELGEFAITCNSIAPGYFVTDLNAALIKDPAFDQRVKTRTALHRWGTPDELAGAAVFLASDAGAYVTGHQLVVDGGFTGTM